VGVADGDRRADASGAPMAASSGRRWRSIRSCASPLPRICTSR
jgi:hypothetical protein